MTKKGFKGVIVREQAYFLASRQAKSEQTSIADITTRAIERYVNQKKEVEEELRSLVEIYAQYRQGTKTLPTPQSTP